MSSLRLEAGNSALTQREVALIAPNLEGKMYLYRPTAGFCDRPLCTIVELETVLTLDHLADFHEILDLRDAAESKARRQAERDQTAQQMRGRR